MDENLLVTKEQMMVIFNRSKRTINHWFQKYNVKPQSNNLYYLPDVVAVFEKTISKTDVQTRLLETKLKKMQYELETMQDKYIEREQIISEWQEMLQSVKQSILVLAVKIAERCVKAKTLASARKVIEEEVMDMFESMHNFAEYTPKLNKKEQKNITQAFYQFWDKIKKIQHNKKITVSITAK